MSHNTSHYVSCHVQCHIQSSCFIWSHLICSDLGWSDLIRSDVWSDLTQSWSDLIWSCLIWSCLISSDLVWSHLIWSCLIWSHLIPSDLIRSCLIWSDQIWSVLNWYACVFVCLSIHPSVCLSVCPSFHLSVFLSLSLSADNFGETMIAPLNRQASWVVSGQDQSACSVADSVRCPLPPVALGGHVWTAFVSQAIPYYISSLSWNLSLWKLPKYSDTLKTEVNWVLGIILPVIGGYSWNEPISEVVWFHSTASTRLVQHLLHESRRSCNKCSTVTMWNWHGSGLRLYQLCNISSLSNIIAMDEKFTHFLQYRQTG